MKVSSIESQPHDSTKINDDIYEEISRELRKLGSFNLPERKQHPETNELGYHSNKDRYSVLKVISLAMGKSRNVENRNDSVNIFYLDPLTSITKHRMSYLSDLKVKEKSIDISISEAELELAKLKLEFKRQKINQNRELKQLDSLIKELS